MPGCGLPQEIRRRLPQRFFRGSITRPTDPLCTLRSLGYPRTTQHSVPAASTLCRVGLFTYRVPQRSFYFLMGASPPSRLGLAHKTQIWIAISVYVLVAIVKKQLKIEASLYTILQILSVSLFEKISIYQALTLSDYKELGVKTDNQLKLFQ